MRVRTWLAVEPMAGEDQERPAHLHARDIDQHAHEHRISCRPHVASSRAPCGELECVCGPMANLTPGGGERPRSVREERSMHHDHIVEPITQRIAERRHLVA